VSDYEAAYRDVRVRVTELLLDHPDAEIEPMLNEIGQPMGQLVFDAWSHEQDIRGPLGEPGGRDSTALEIAFAWFHEASAGAAPGGVTLELVTDDGTYVIGAGEPDRTLRASRYEFLRTVTGRRSRAQVRALDCDGPPLDEIMFENDDVFTPAAHDVVE
jgi:hypothetical protein